MTPRRDFSDLPTDTCAPCPPARTPRHGGLSSSWQTSAACTQPGADPAWWAAEGITADAQHARAWCARCPVRELCLAAALRWERGAGPEGRWGIYGGLGPAERARVAKRRAKATA